MRKRSQKNKKSQRQGSSPPPRGSNPRGRGRTEKRESGGRGPESRPRFHPRQGQGGQRTFIGKVQKNPRGFAFLLPEDPSQDDVFVPQGEAGFLLNDDRVEYRVHRQGKRSSGEIVRVLERGQKEILGKVHHWREGWGVETMDHEAHQLERDTKNPPDGEWVIARFVRYPGRESGGVVAIREVLGPHLSPEHDIKIALSRFGLPSDFDAPVNREAGSMAELCLEETQHLSPGRKDHRELPFVTIDGEDAKDFDDAVFVTIPKQGPAFILYVAIADVSFVVRPDSALDKSARGRGTSVYFPGKAIPMLPEKLSNDLCSLNPRTDKLVLTAEIHFDREGAIVKSVFYEAVIRTAARLTYEQVHDFFEKKVAPPPELEEPLGAAFRLYRKLRQQRKMRGVLDFQLPEGKIEVDKHGVPLKIYRASRHDSHQLIEEFMISANRVVAKALKDAQVGALYRVHDNPDPKTLDDINQLMRSLGISKAIKDLSTHSLSHLLESTAGLRGSKTLHKAILRLQKQARYEPDPRGHFGLALADYTHFTSPIRRYPDLVVHRALKELIARGKRSDTKYDGEYFESVGAESSERERRAMEAERFVVKRKQCWFMSKHVGESFKGIIAGVTAKGLFVEISEFVIDGFLPLELMNGRYEYDEMRLCLRKRPGHTTLSLGDEIEIKVEDVNLDENEITFAHKVP